MLWMRFSHGHKTGFGVLEGDKVRLYRGDMFSAHERTDELIALALARITCRGVISPYCGSDYLSI